LSEGFLIDDLNVPLVWLPWIGDDAWVVERDLGKLMHLGAMDTELGQAASEASRLL
jgi:hypothetical protein